MPIDVRNPTSGTALLAPCAYAACACASVAASPGADAPRGQPAGSYWTPDPDIAAARSCCRASLSPFLFVASAAAACFEPTKQVPSAAARSPLLLRRRLLVCAPKQTRMLR